MSVLSGRRICRSTPWASIAAILASPMSSGSAFTAAAQLPSDDGESATRKTDQQ